NGQYDVARFRIDLDRAAWTFPLHALGGGDQRIAIGLAAGLLQRLVNEVHAVVAADREDVRKAFVIVVERLRERLALRRLVVVVEVRRGDDADRNIAHAFQRAFIGEHVLAHDHSLLRIDAALGQRLADRGRLRPTGYPDVDRVSAGILGALNER